MEIEVEVAVIIQNTPPNKNGASEPLSIGNGIYASSESIPKNNNIPEMTHPMIGPIIVFAT